MAKCGKAHYYDNQTRKYWTMECQCMPVAMDAYDYTQVFKMRLTGYHQYFSPLVCQITLFGKQSEEDQKIIKVTRLASPQALSENGWKYLNSFKENSFITKKKKKSHNPLVLTIISIYYNMSAH